MNIAFYTSYELSPFRGGTERVTLSVANSLRNLYGHKCYSLYTKKSEGFEVEHLDGALMCSGKSQYKAIAEFVKDNNIEVLISQGAFRVITSLKPLVDSTCKLVLVHHFEPGWEAHFTNRTRLKNTILGNAKLKDKARAIYRYIFLNNYIKCTERKLRIDYKSAYDAADTVVLLSKGFIPQFMEFAGIKDSSKFRVIPNMLSFENVHGAQFVNKKNKEVLIVTRLTEPQKRISVALKIWTAVCKSPLSNGWKLNIVGHGEHESMYKNIVKKEEIPHVAFCGLQDPREYYKKAAIFMMTSKSEGWGLTITESMQYGVVPIAFDSYASVKDIITDGADGFLVLDLDIEQYENRMLLLMENAELREKMATKAASDCNRFSDENVGAMWNELMTEIYETKVRVD